MHSCHKMKSILIRASMQIGRLWPGSSVWSWILASVYWKQWWQCWNKCSHKKRRSTICRFVRTCWANRRLITSLAVMSCNVTATSQRQNDSLWSDDVKSSSKKKFRMQPWMGEVMYTVSSGRKGMIFLDFLEPEQITNSDNYIITLNWRLKCLESDQRGRQPFSCKTIAPNPIPV